MVREEEQTVKHSYKVGDKILFKCNEGYVKLGNNPFIRCMASSKWSRLQGKCLSECLNFFKLILSKFRIKNEFFQENCHR